MISLLREKECGPHGMNRRRLAWIALIAASCLALLAAAVADGDTLGFDRDVRRQMQGIASPGLTRLMEEVTLLGSQTAVLAVAGCGAAGLLFAGRRRQAVLMVIAMGVAELLLWAFKISFRRQRPDAFFGLPLPVSYSFPSGHSLLSMCCYGTLASLVSSRRRVRIAAAVLVLAIGISRAYLGVHYPTDVIGGFLLGAAWLACLAFFYQR